MIQRVSFYFNKKIRFEIIINSIRFCVGISITAPTCSRSCDASVDSLPPIVDLMTSDGVLKQQDIRKGQMLGRCD